MTNLETLLNELEQAASPGNGRNVILTKLRLRVLLEACRVMKEALEFYEKTHHIDGIKFKSYAEKALAQVDEICGGKT